jgi:hypothetical protein
MNTNKITRLSRKPFCSPHDHTNEAATRNPRKWGKQSAHQTLYCLMYPHKCSLVIPLMWPVARLVGPHHYRRMWSWERLLRNQITTQNQCMMQKEGRAIQYVPFWLTVTTLRPRSPLWFPLPPSLSPSLSLSRRGIESPLKWEQNEDRCEK